MRAIAKTDRDALGARAARVAPVDKLSDVFVAIFAIAFLGERISAANWLGIILIAGGTYLVAFR